MWGWLKRLVGTADDVRAVQEGPAAATLSAAAAQRLADDTNLPVTTLDGKTYKSYSLTLEERAAHCDAMGDHDSAAMYRAVAERQRASYATDGPVEKVLTRHERVEQFCRENDVVSEVSRGDGRIEQGDLTMRELMPTTGTSLAPRSTDLADRPRGAFVTDEQRVMVAQRDRIEELESELAETRVTTAEVDRLRMEKADADRQRDAVQKKYRPMKYPGWRYHVDGKREPLLVKNKAHERHACVPHGDWFETPTDAAAARQALEAHAKAPAARKRLAARKRALKGQPALTAKGE